MRDYRCQSPPRRLVVRVPVFRHTDLDGWRWWCVVAECKMEKEEVLGRESGRGPTRRAAAEWGRRTARASNGQGRIRCTANFSRGWGQAAGCAVGSQLSRADSRLACLLRQGGSRTSTRIGVQAFLAQPSSPRKLNCPYRIHYASANTSDSLARVNFGRSVDQAAELGCSYGLGLSWSAARQWVFLLSRPLRFSCPPCDFAIS